MVKLIKLLSMSGETILHQSSMQICNNNTNLVTCIRDNNINPIISLIVPRMVNSYLPNICDNFGFSYIRHKTI